MSASSENRERLARTVVRLEPEFASETCLLSALLAAPGDALRTGLPPALTLLRRQATERAWHAGLSTWNARALERAAFLNDLAERTALVRLVQMILAADFAGVALDGFDASGAIFPGDLLLTRAAVAGPLYLDGAQVLGPLVGTGIRIAGEFSAEQTLFAAPVSLSEALISRRTRFGHAVFQSDLRADRATFAREFWLRHATVRGAFHMRSARLLYDGGLGACRYHGSAIFDGTHFADTLSLEQATFHQRLSLDGCVFEGLVRTKDAAFEGGISTVGTRFKGQILPPLQNRDIADASPHGMIVRLRAAFHAP